MEDLRERYFSWMCGLVYDETGPQSFGKLLRYLNHIDFNVDQIKIVGRDVNRAYDGLEFRNRFVYENNIDSDDIYKAFEGKECSVLEMIIALAFKIEEHIMCDPDVGDRTGQWFWTMIVSLGLGGMTDENFNKEIVDDILLKFLYREYKSNGEGGLVTIPDCDIDLRTIEIWYQLQMYLNYISG